MNLKVFMLGFLFVVFTCMSVMSEVKPGGIFGDNMVLQRDAELPIWGWAGKKERINVEFNGETRSAMSDDEGKWLLRIGPFSAGGPFLLRITGANTVEYKNIMIGDVWLCSGQSNMQYPLKDEANGEAELHSAMHSGIRLIKIGGTAPVPSEDLFMTFPHISRNWMQCDPSVLKWFSAVAYYFGRDLNERLNIPIGLIETAEGSTPIRAWISPDSQRLNPLFKDDIADYSTYLERKKTFDAKMAEYQAALNKSNGDGLKPPAHPGFFEAYASSPGLLYNARIHPLAPFAIKGVIWYQGENEAYYRHSATYHNHFLTMIENWRKLWKQDLPFIFVQLAPINSIQQLPAESTWAEVRNAQRESLKLSNTAMVVTTDICESGLHPRKKAELAKRLSMAARAIAYNEKVEYSGPLFSKIEFNDGKARIFFTHAEKGLISREGMLKGFSIAGADRQFVWADAVIDGDTVIISSEKVKNPEAVRYAWADNPLGNLFNKDGFPASCFKTDKW